MSVAALILPMFCTVLAGWLAAVSGYVSQKMSEGLSEYVFSVAVPALIVSTLCQPSQGVTIQANFWFAYFGGCAILWTGMACYFAFRLHHPRRAAVLQGFAASQANTIFFGVPIILKVFGAAGAVPLFMLLAVHLPLMMGAATLVIEGDADVAWFDRLIKLARVLVRNPILLALAVGAFLRYTGIGLGGVPKTVLDAFGATASTCALLALGVAMRRYSVKRDLGAASLLAVGKLILHPFLVWLLAYHVFSMPPAFAGVATLFAAMPVGVNAYLIAAKYGQAEASISAAIVLSTIGALFTVAAWARFVAIPPT